MEVTEAAERPLSLSLDLRDCHRYHDYLHIASADELDDADNYFDSTESKTFDATPDSGIHDLSSVDPEQRAKLEEDWKAELAKTEDEILTLRQVLSAKVRHAQDLKRKLGITPWKELKEDMEQGFRNIQETAAIKEVGGKLVEWNSAITSAPIHRFTTRKLHIQKLTGGEHQQWASLPGIFNSTAYQRTSQTLKTASEKTTSVLGNLGASMTKKLGEVKNSSAFRSFEEKMGSAYTNVRSKVASNRSTSLYSFEEALNSSDRRSGFSSAATTPTIPERNPIP